MSFITFVTERLAAITAQLNAIGTNAKKIDELPVQSTLDPISKLHVSNAGVSQSLTIQKIIDAIIGKTFSHLLEVGEIDVTGLVVTVPAGAKWVYEGINYGTLVDTNITETLCEADYLRKDILVANQLNQIVLIKGDESETIRVIPNVPIGSILVSEIDIDDAVIGTPSLPVTIQELTNKLDKDGYAGTAKTLNDAIIALAFPDTVLKTGEITVDGLGISILANDFQWRLAQTDFLTTPIFSETLTAATEGFHRTDRLEGDNTGNYFIHEGTEDDTLAPAPAVTVGRISLATIPIFGAVIGIPETAFPNEIETPFTVIDRPNKRGTSIWAFCLSQWKWVGGVAVYINTFIDNVTERYDVQYPNKTGGAVETFAMVSDIEALETAVDDKLDLKVDKDGAKVLSDVNFSTSLSNKLASIDATHYLPPLQTTVQLSALPQAGISDKARVYVEADLSDYFYDTTASSGDIAPDDQAGGVGFWRKVAVGGETAASIKTKYESNADTNAFTNALKSKLDSITAIFTTALKTAYDTVVSDFATLLATGSRLITTGEITKLSNTSNTNSGDETTGSLKTKIVEFLGYAAADETTPMTTGLKVTFRMPFGMTLTDVRINTTDAPTITSLIADIKQGGASLFSILPRIDYGTTTSVGSATPHVISTATLTDNSIITIHVTQVGSGAGVAAGTGFKVYLYGYKT